MIEKETVKDKIKRWKERKRQLRKLRKDKEKIQNHGIKCEDVDATIKQVQRENITLDQDVNR